MDKIITGKMNYASYNFAMDPVLVTAYGLQQIINALPVAALYAALSFAYGLTFSLHRRPDLTTGALFAFAGQAMVLFAMFGWNVLWLTLPATIAFSGMAAFLYTIGVALLLIVPVVKRFSQASRNSVIILSVAFVIILMESVRIAAGAHESWLSPFLNQPIMVWANPVFSVIVTPMKIAIAILPLILIVVVSFVMGRSSMGRIWRAVSDDALAARMLGVDTDRVFAVTNGVSAALAGITGILATAYYGSMDFGAGLMFGLKVVMVSAIGASMSPQKAAMGAALYGLAESLWGGYFPLVWRDIVLFSLLVLIAVWRQDRQVP